MAEFLDPVEANGKEVKQNSEPYRVATGSLFQRQLVLCFAAPEMME